MIDLSDTLGLNVILNEETGKLEFGDEVTCESEVEIQLDEMQPVLLNKFLKYPENVYTQHKNVCNGVVKHTNELTYDILHIPQGLLGIEYARTHIYYSEHKPTKFDCILEVVVGEITVFIQKNKENDHPFAANTEVEEIALIQLSEGDRFAVPTGVMYTIVNTGNAHSVISIITQKSHSRIDYAKLQKEKGLAFYIISKNAKAEIVANPKYKINEHPIQVELDNLEEELKARFLHDFVVDAETSLYMALQNNINRFLEVLT